LDAARSQAAARANPAPPRVEPVAAPAPLAVAAPGPAAAHPKVHIVKERETISSIAAQYGVKTSAILAANPQVDPRRLRIGQSLNLP
jgi:LysM repeat protein